MKIKKLTNYHRVALAALGVFLGRGAQADTILDFDTLPNGVANNDIVAQTFGDTVSASSDGITVAGFGTPNIGLTWKSTGGTWQHYTESGGGAIWTAMQLDSSGVGDRHELVFTPNNSATKAVIKSFNFHGYYVSDERFTYDVSVLAGTNVVSGPINFSFVSDATKNHLVSINYTGAIGQTLKLRLARVASTLSGIEVEGDPADIAVDDITFAQLPASVQPVGPQVVAVSPADDEVGVAAPKSYSASITNGASTVVAGSIQLKLDGSPVSPPPSISSAGGLTNVSYQAPDLLAVGSTHSYTLSYNDNVGSNYINEVTFTVVTNYVTLPLAYALPSGAGVVRGFTYRTVSASTEATDLPGTIARAKAQLAGTLINTNTSLPYTNSATPGTNADGSFNIDTVINFADIDTPDLGNFINDVTFPGLPTGPNEWFATEAALYLDLAAGYNRLAVSSDDGFEVSALPPQGVVGPPIVLGSFNNNRGVPDGDTVFDVVVQTSGIYCFQVIYFESLGYASCEFYSVNLANSQKMLINTNDPSAIRSYRVLKPRITGIVRSGPNAVIDWAYGTPPFQVQFKTNVTDAVWSNVGSTTSNRTANVPIQPNTGFIRVLYVQP